MDTEHQNAALLRKTAHLLDLLSNELRVQAGQLAGESRGAPNGLMADATEAHRAARLIRRLSNRHPLPWSVSSRRDEGE